MLYSNVLLSRRDVLGAGFTALALPVWAGRGKEGVGLRVQTPESLGFDDAKLVLAVDAVKQLVEQDGVPSAVFAVGRAARGGVKQSGVALRAVFNAASNAGNAGEVVGADTLFDLASLTKVVALTTVVAALVEQKRLNIDTPVREVLPQWETLVQAGAQAPPPPPNLSVTTPAQTQPVASPELWQAKKHITVRHLLTHTAGFPAGGAYTGRSVTLGQAVGEIARARPLSLPGQSFLYSDYSAVLLGAIVEAVSARNLDTFCYDDVFRPLRMDSTMYRPPVLQLSRCAPTTPPDFTILSPGLVHDPTARALGGVSGNAGLFSTIDDLSRFCLMWLNNGQIYDPAKGGPKRLLSAQTVREFTRAQTGYGENKRALGFDVDSPYSIRGDFAPGSYGHTGYTGTSLWLDSQSGVFVILLTNAVHGTDAARQTLIKTRRVISSLVAASLRA